MPRFLLLIVVVILVPIAVSAQSKNAVELRKIDALARSIDRAVKVDQGKVIVADVADFDKDKAEWKLFDSENELEKFREKKNETYTIAYNWKRSGRVIASNFTLFSSSGDWTKYVLHYFRTDGSVGLVRSELRTFYVNLS